GGGVALMAGQGASMRGEHPDRTVRAVAYRDGTVVLSSTCGCSRTAVRLDVCRAAQLSAGIWEAAGAAQQLTGGFGGGGLPLPPLFPGSAAPPEIWLARPGPSAPVQDLSPSCQRLPRVNQDAAREARRTLGRRIRQIRHARNKSLQDISGLAGIPR